ncbi:hypothetical protein B0H13DRAFT_2334177 [Mycena leptocephala]|nr:hypothetical protein B0H13DRAFT_2334177 [Mycena leptocephala]
MAARIVQMFILAAAAAHFAAASPTPEFVTVLDPVGSEPVPITATVLGVDSQGHTTYAIALTDAFATEVAIIVAATDYYSFIDVIKTDDETLAVGGECGLKGSTAICTVRGPATTTVITETALGTVVFDIGATTIPVEPSSAAPVTGENSSAAPIIGASGSESAFLPTPTDRQSSGQRMSCSVLVAFIVISFRLGYYLI